MLGNFLEHETEKWGQHGWLLLTGCRHVMCCNKISCIPHISTQDTLKTTNPTQHNLATFHRSLRDTTLQHSIITSNYYLSQNYSKKLIFASCWKKWVYSFIRVLRALRRQIKPIIDLWTLTHWQLECNWENQHNRNNICWLVPNQFQE